MVHILCFGNLWHGDDGFGIHVCRALRSRVREEAARVFEVGLRSLDALSLFERCDDVILVDALREPGTPEGTVRVLTPDELPSDQAACGHAFGVNYLLQAHAATRTTMPSITLVGAVAGAVRPFTDRLSEALQSAVDVAIDEILGRLPTAAVAETC